MTHTEWFDYSNTIAPTNAIGSDTIIQDIFEVGEFSEYTILKVVGEVVAISDTMTNGEEMAMALGVLHNAVGATNEPNPMTGSVIDGAAQAMPDTEGFWMRKWRAYFTDHQDNFVYDPVYFEIDTRRIVREGEELKLMHHCTGDTTGYFFIWMRILILRD